MKDKTDGPSESLSTQNELALLGITDELLEEADESSATEKIYSLAEHVCFHEYKALPLELVDYLKYALTAFFYLNDIEETEETKKLLSTFDQWEVECLKKQKATRQGKPITLDESFSLVRMNKVGRPSESEHKHESKFLEVLNKTASGLTIKEAVSQVFKLSNTQDQRRLGLQQEFSRWRKKHEMKERLTSALVDNAGRHPPKT